MNGCYGLIEANQRLPGLTAAASRLMQLIVHLCSAQRRFEQLSAELAVSPDATTARSRAERERGCLMVLAGQYHDELQRLSSSGYAVHADEEIRFDWPARIGGRDLTLSWQLGEARVTHCLGVDGERRPLTQVLG